MSTNPLRRVALSLVVLSSLLSAQPERQHDPVALKHWAAPLYWQPIPANDDGNRLANSAATTGLPASASALVFVAMQPCRVVDTRASSQGFTGPFGPPSLLGGATRTFPILSSTTCTIPAVAQAYSFDITVVPPGPLGYLTAYPTGQPSPVAAVAVESPQGALASNTGIIPAGINGSVDVYASNPTEVVIDINGYYAAITDGGLNTAVGEKALLSNTTGAGNTASGAGALFSNTTGNNNTAGGLNTLASNTTGGENTATGWDALINNTTGNENTATGIGALGNNTTGNYNTAIGANTLERITSGSNNIAIGYMAGFPVADSNSNNIHIGSIGSINDNATIRLGNPPGVVAPPGLGPIPYQNSFFAAGIRGITTGNNDAVPVVIDSNGQLGTVSSSARFKEDIQDMSNASDGLLRLRPVTFRYTKPFADGSTPIQYGLIAEEVDKVYPDLVAHSADGQIETVKYQVLDSMLLNEFQKEHRQIQQQAETIQQLQDRLTALEELVRPVK